MFNVIKKSSLINPKVSIILLDWGCREKYFTLDWLNRQNIDRDQYELIWVELYNNTPDIVTDKVDTVIECNQKGVYHKHKGYNAGLLNAKGKIITVCDSDAVFPPDFINSIINSFNKAYDEHKNIILMHYEWRTASRYPEGGLETIEDLKEYKWDPLWPNVGACFSVKKKDAVTFGGFDEHRSYRGYICGPYDLGWRLINAGYKEIWHDKEIALWHFSHPNPTGERNEKFKLKYWFEIKNIHFKGHAFTSIKNFTKGKVLPKKENPIIFNIRLASRHIGTNYEKEYSQVKHLFILFFLIKLFLIIEPFLIFIVKILKRLFGETNYARVRDKIKVIIKKLMNKIVNK